MSSIVMFGMRRRNCSPIFSLSARHPHMTFNVLIESTVYCFEPLRHVFDAVELGGFSKCQQVANHLGALDAPFEEGGIEFHTTTGWPHWGYCKSSPNTVTSIGETIRRQKINLPSVDLRPIHAHLT